MSNGHGYIRFSDKADMSWPAFCQRLFDAAIDAVIPAKVLPQYLPEIDNYTAVKVIAVGKDAAQMASVVEQHWPSSKLSGLVICPYGKAPKTSLFDVVEASHPLPDNNSVKAAKKAIEVARSCRETELLLILLSGGGSALMAQPIKGLSLSAKQQVIDALLNAGATINEINSVRRKLSTVKGGKLLVAAKCAKKVVTLAVSDVVSDDPHIIASGPTVLGQKDDTSKAMAVLEKYGVNFPQDIDWSGFEEGVKVTDHSYQIIAGGTQMLAAAHRFLEAEGFSVVNIGHTVEGEAGTVAAIHAESIQEQCTQVEGDKPIAFLSGGELTVTVSGTGLGGPNQEYILALMDALPCGKYYAFAADTDGTDGKGGAGGALFEPRSYTVAKGYGLDREKYLLNNDSFNYFNKLNGVFKPKSNVLNVNDLRVVCWLPDLT